MPKTEYWDEIENDQDWEQIVLTKINKPVENSKIELSIGSKIKNARRVAHMTQKALSQSLGIKSTILDAYEMDKIPVPNSHMVKINRILGSSIKF